MRHSTSIQMFSDLLAFYCKLFLAYASKNCRLIAVSTNFMQCKTLLCSHTVPKSDNGMRGTWLQWVYLLS